MARKAAVKKQRKSVSRIKTFDEKYLGPEPDLRGEYDRVDLARAYNWYNYFCNSDDAKKYVLEYLKEFKHDKKLQKDFSKVDAKVIPNSVGWNCRILTLGGHLSEELTAKTIERIKTLAETSKPEEVVEVVEQKKVVVSIQDRIREKVYDLVAEIEEQLDIFFETGSTEFDIKNWLTQNDVKPAIASKIGERYKPLYAELYDAVEGKDKELKDAYKHIKKPVLKKILAFVKDIIALTEQRATVMKATRKPRKKKEKPAAVLVAKMQYLEQSDEYGIKSPSPTEIIGSSQVWVFNTKYRKLTVLNAMGPAGLSVKGTTITGFDEKTSQTKALRKPKESLDRVLNGGKIVLRKLMDELKTKPQEAKGRINTDTVIVRVIK